MGYTIVVDERELGARIIDAFRDGKTIPPTALRFLGVALGAIDDGRANVYSTGEVGFTMEEYRDRFFPDHKHVDLACANALKHLDSSGLVERVLSDFGSGKRQGDFSMTNFKFPEGTYKVVNG